MADMKLVLGIYGDEAAADAAASSLMAWEKANDVVHRPVGVLVADDGRIKEHKLGQRDGKKGAGIGLVLAVIAPPALLAGIVGGGILGHFHHKGLGLTDADRERIAGQLAGGKAGVGVLVETDEEATMISRELAELGGTPETHAVSHEALEAVAAAAPEASAGAEAPRTEA
ncbi:MAG: hypothetical protein WCH74_14795 [Chloroflexota bacterium]